MSGCTVGPDGKLLDAKDIVWFEDADSSEPINHTTTPSSTTTASTSTANHAPAPVVAGARRSGRAIRPSIRVTDPDNAEAHKLKGPNTNPDNAEASSLATMHKRKASRTMVAERHINRKVAIDDNGSTDGSEVSDYKPDVVELPPASSDNEAGETEPDEEADIGYASTKAMGDADREVSISFLQKLHDISTSVRNLADMSRLIALPIFTPSSIRKMNMSTPTSVQKRRVIFVKSVGKCLSVINSLLIICADKTHNLVQKVYLQGITSSKVACLHCVCTFHGRSNTGTQHLYHC
jgi:hypothetical protein